MMNLLEKAGLVAKVEDGEGVVLAAETEVQPEGGAGVVGTPTGAWRRHS
jgi:hypothetical protein